MLRKSGKSKTATHAPAPRRVTSAGASAPLPTHDEIRVRAYELYCERNGAPGDPMADWLRAERELIVARQAGETAAGGAEPPSVVTRQRGVRGVTR